MSDLIIGGGDVKSKSLREESQICILKEGTSSLRAGERGQESVLEDMSSSDV